MAHEAKTQYDRILDVIRWDAEKDMRADNKYAWYRCHCGK